MRVIPITRRVLCILAARTPQPLRHMLKRHLVPGFILRFMYPSRGGAQQTHAKRRTSKKQPKGTNLLGKITGPIKRRFLSTFILMFVCPRECWQTQKNAMGVIFVIVNKLKVPQRLAWFEFGRNLLIESHNSLSEQGELRGARAALNHLLAYNSDSPKICVLVAQFALRIGDHQQAFDLACSALALDRNCSLGGNNRVQSL